MHWLLHIPGQPSVTLDKPLTSIGPDAAADITVAQAGTAPVRLRADGQALWIETEEGQSVHVNGRRIRSLAMLRPGDDIHIGGALLKLAAAVKPASSRGPSGKPLNFADRVLLRALTGAEAGRAFALVNSLCIGRSGLSEIQVDDLALAERQVLVQRQGNDILAKNLSPVLEMRVDGWVCDDALLRPGSQLSIEQHRFLLEAPCADMALAAEPPIAEAGAPVSQAPAELTPPSGQGLFSRAQWILLAVAIAVSALLVLLLTFSP